MKIATLLLAAAGMALAPISALAFDGFKSFKHDRWDIQSSGQYYRTTANYDQSGNQANLPGGNSFQEFKFDFGARYFLGRTGSFFLDATLNSAESHDASATRTNSSFTQVMVGGDWIAYSDGFEIVPEVSAVLPIEKNTPGGDAVLNGEGVMEFRPKLQVQKQFSAFGGYANGGFTYRDKGRSYLLPWAVGAFLRFPNSRLGAELNGYQSMTDDTDTKNRTSRQAALISTNANSDRYGSVNPSLMDTNFFYHAGLRGPWSFEFDGGISLMGSNAASGIHVGALIRYSFDLARGYVQEPVYRSKVPQEAPRGRSQMYDGEPSLSTGKSVNQFEEDTGDGVDQSLFRNRAQTPKPKAKPKPVAPAKPRLNDESLQQQLDNTEMQIELKSTRKRK